MPLLGDKQMSLLGDKQVVLVGDIEDILVVYDTIFDFSTYLALVKCSSTIMKTVQESA